MRLQELKSALTQVDQLRFVDSHGQVVPAHFHLTEVGRIEKHFIDCGGTMRKESKINFQLYTASDYDHRLGVQKMNSILNLSEQKLGLTDTDIEVEYQGETVGKYGLSFDGKSFHLLPTQTDCLAKEECGIPKPRVKLSDLNQQSASCTPESGCC